MRRHGRVIAASGLLLLALVALLFYGVARDDAQADAGAILPTQPAVYRSTAGGFTITYDASVLTPAAGGASDVAPGVLPGSVAANEALVYRDSQVQSPLIPEGLMIAVIHLDRAVQPAEIGGLAGAIRPYFAGLQASQEDDRFGPLRPVTIAGLHGFAISYSFNPGTAMQVTEYVLFAGHNQYELTLRATTSTWPTLAPILDATVRSLRVTAQF
jgi:hypothetical protein